MGSWSAISEAMTASVVSALGREVTYQPVAPNAAAQTISGIVESPDRETENPEGPFLELFLRLSGLAAAPERGDTVTVDSTTYVVVEIEADQAGGVHLGLHRQ